MTTLELITDSPPYKFKSLGILDDEDRFVGSSDDFKKDNEYKQSITTLEINNLFGDPKVILGLKKEEILVNLRNSRFEETIFYNFWIDRLNNIKKYVMNNKDSKIGDIINLTKEEQKIMSMLEIIKDRVDNNRGGGYINLDVNNEFRLNNIIIQN